MRYTHRERIIQLSLIVFCCLFVAVSRTEVSVNSQSCIVPNLAPPPKFSWYKNQQVAVRIDDAWSPEERGYFQQGIEKWNQALNCSGFSFMIIRLFTLPIIVLAKLLQTLPFGGQRPPHSASDISSHFQRVQNVYAQLSSQLRSLNTTKQLTEVITTGSSHLRIQFLYRSVSGKTLTITAHRNCQS